MRCSCSFCLPPPTPGRSRPARTIQGDLLLDLRPLNEKTAGAKGFVKSDGGTGFALADGTPVRFWCVNSFVGREKRWADKPLWPKGAPDLARHARFLAQRGVNMVRLHAHLNPSPAQAITDINEAERDWIWRAVAAYKKEGIYTTISPYFVLDVRLGKDWGVEGPAGSPPFGALFLDDKLQAAYKTWWKKLLVPKNPHTGIPLAKDSSWPSSSCRTRTAWLFWTLGTVQGGLKKRLEKKFADWAAKRHGSLGQGAGGMGEQGRGAVAALAAGPAGQGPPPRRRGALPRRDDVRLQQGDGVLPA